MWIQLNLVLFPFSIMIFILWLKYKKNILHLSNQIINISLKIEANFKRHFGLVIKEEHAHKREKGILNAKILRIHEKL